MGITLASLMSSVSGLNDKPRRAIFLSLRLPSCCLQNWTAFSGWVLLTFSTDSRSSGW